MTLPCDALSHAWSAYSFRMLTPGCGCNSLQVLLADIMMRLESMLRIVSDEGFGPLEQAYTDSWLHTGQQVGAHGITKPRVFMLGA